MGRYYQGPVSDHFDGERFFIAGRGDASFHDLLRWRFNGARARWPADFPSVFAGQKPPIRAQNPRISLIGHASWLLQIADLNILVDPVWSERASPLSFAGPKRVNPPGIALADLPPIDAILITHNHYDHLDLRSIAALWGRFRPRIVAPLGNDAIIRRAGTDIAVDVLDWGEALSLGDITVHLEPALHWSARGLRDRRCALWGAYVLKAAHRLVYVAGDTGYGAHFRAIRDRYGPPDVALLPIGAYEPRWFMRGQHMNPQDAVQAMQDLGAAQALGCHWGTFQLTDEPVDAPEQALAVALAEAGIAPARFRALRPGEAFAP
jgi:L-ascorbate metabolism protein UlaG (beta-lactamase superfamily)